ncbi:hypothetical protein [Pseudomonas ogarae]
MCLMQSTPPNGNYPGCSNGYIEYKNKSGQDEVAISILAGRYHSRKIILGLSRFFSMSILECLCESDVLRTVCDSEYLQIYFSKGEILNIYNSYSLAGASLGSLVGKKLRSVTEDSEVIELKFDDLAVLTIDMKPEAFDGPEAMQLLRDGEATVIWS